jgi:Xaa-Pro aminopeptidase
MDQQIFANRRQRFLRQMQAGSIAIFAAAPVHIRNGDVEYEYRQDSDFYYLTGFEEPESLCLLMPGHPKYEYVLFVRQRDREKETWTGRRAGVEGAIQTYRAEMSHPISKLDEILPEFLQNATALYYQLNKHKELDNKILAMIDFVRQRYRSGIYPPSLLIDPSRTLEQMRAIKSRDEIQALQKAAEISARGHRAAMETARPGVHEYEIQAALEYVFRSNGSMRNGYPSIVGSGTNSCILHYTANNRLMQDGDLLLVDAGAEFDYYTADITRTYPVNGKFSTEQKAVYEVVLNAQKKAIYVSRPGVNIAQVHAIAVEALTEGMIDLGLLSGTLKENLENQSYTKYYLHRTSHWLGMDVHDTGVYKTGDQWTVLEPGMVLTVEPGLYIAADEGNRFENIGIRIEDDILVTEDEPVVLSAGCPKEIQELEAIIGTKGIR